MNIVNYINSFLALFIGNQQIYPGTNQLDIPPNVKEASLVKLSNMKKRMLVEGYCKKHIYSSDIYVIIALFIYQYYSDPFQYRGKNLPKSLFGHDLSEFDFTGCHFTYTNLTNSNLQNAILDNTTCNYQDSFKKNINKNKCKGGEWYKKNILKDLESIAEVYPKLSNKNKVKLLHIASGFSQLPFFEGIDFYIQVEYWSALLLELKQQLEKPYSEQLICSLGGYLQEHVRDYLWTTSYLDGSFVLGNHEGLYGCSEAFLDQFRANISLYCTTTDSSNIENDSGDPSAGAGYYTKVLESNAKWLKKVHTKIQDSKLHEEAESIFNALLKSFQVGKMKFLLHYLSIQNQLMWFKEKLNPPATRVSIGYDQLSIYVYQFSWERK